MLIMILCILHQNNILRLISNLGFLIPTKYDESCDAARHHSELEDQAVVMSLGLVGLLLTYDEVRMTWPVICYPFVVRIMLIILIT